ncbi:MAG: hypothetical protein GXY77_15305 [Fibrobacter sp.]|nr:hypothetical protein [Fibrobacter sp.]
MRDETKGMPREHVLEIISAVLLSLATVASAWSAYQATRWSGVQAIKFSEASAIRTEATRKTNIAAQLVGVDVGMFVQYATAITQNNKMLADFLFQRFRPEFKKAVEKWLNTKPLKNSNAPASPFKMKEYSIKEMQESQKLISKAQQSFEKAKNANQTGDNYVLLTVLFASVLFFAGVGTKFQLFKLKVIMLSFGLIIFTIALMVLFSFPVH